MIFEYVACYTCKNLAKVRYLVSSVQGLCRLSNVFSVYHNTTCQVLLLHAGACWKTGNR